MKTSFLLVTLLALAGAASASDVTEKSHGQTVLKTSHSAQCSTPSGKATKECAKSASTQSSTTRQN